MEERRNANEESSEKDSELKSKLKTCVKILCQENPEFNINLQKFTVDSWKDDVPSSSTNSLTDLLKLLKSLCPHYETLKKCYHNEDMGVEGKRILADVLSVLAMVKDLSESEAGTKRETLKYRLLGSEDDFTAWGVGYVNHLVTQVMDECNEFFREGEDVGSSSVDEEDSSVRDYKKVLLKLVNQIFGFYLTSGLEIEAVDLAMEIEQPSKYLQLVVLSDQKSYKKTCMYMTSLAKHRFIDYGDKGLDSLVDTAFIIYVNFKEYASALRLALFMKGEDNMDVTYVFMALEDLVQKKQLCSMIARHGIQIKLDHHMVDDEEDRKELQGIINKLRWSEDYLALARNLDVMEPKTVEDVYKGSRSGWWGKTLADVFVNAFVNAGFGTDSLMVGQQDPDFMNDLEEKMSQAASLGVIMLWNVDGGLAELQRYMQYNDSFVKAGALLGVGILNSSVKPDCDPALKFLLDYVYKTSEFDTVRIGAIMGLGLAYAYSRNEQVTNKLIEVMEDLRSSIELLAFVAISLGLVHMGSCNRTAVDAIVTAIRLLHQSIPEHSLIEDSLPFMRLICFGFSLLFWGKPEEMMREEMDCLPIMNEKTTNCFVLSLLSCAYAGSGDVDRVKYLLQYCDEEVAVLGIAMVAMAEEVGLEMAIRSLDHLLQYGEQNVRKTVPLALALLCISNPKKSNVVNTLSRLTHDSNLEVAMSAIISLGLVGSGTNNGRIAWKLRKLLKFYAYNFDALFCVQIALGLLHLGKGLLTLDPYHSDRLLLSPVAIGGLVTFLHCCIDMRALLLDNYHFVLYFLVLAMQPRMLLTLDENLKMIHVPVCVGEAVDVVGKAGQPRTISGSQTFNTPVLLGYGERAELSTTKYVPLSPILEGFVILKHNPDYKAGSD